MTERITAIATVIAAGGAIWIGILQLQINKRQNKINDFVALSLLPGENGTLKIINTGATNVYIKGYQINDYGHIFDRERLITAGTLENAFYWFPVNRVEGNIHIKIYSIDEFGGKFITEGGGEGIKNGEILQIKIWTYKTYLFEWKL